MNMRNRVIRILLAAFATLLSVWTASAQGGATNGFSPYSVYGIGVIQTEGSAFNMTQGGVGIATRDKRFVNYLNPASVTARDSLSFMADFGVFNRNSIFRQGDMKSANNLFNISDFVISFPIYRSSAMMIGVKPFSSSAYNFSKPETRPEVIGNVGNVTTTSSGNGGIYEIFVGGAITFWKRLSIGGQYIFYLGNIDKEVAIAFDNDKYRDVSTGYSLQMRGHTGKIGIQYDQPLTPQVTMTIGATYRFRTALRGYVKDYSYASVSSLVDTLRNNQTSLKDDKIKFADEWGVGLSFRGSDQWSAEVNFLQSDWRKSNFDNVNGFACEGSEVFRASVFRSFRAGFSYTPNRNDIRYYYRRITFRGGVYYDQSYYTWAGKRIDGFGITFGATLPVFRGYNGITVGIDIGQRGKLADNRIRERYIGFNVGFNIFDIWFQKHQYE